MATASEDGLVCVHDTSQSTEENALLSVLNVEAPLRNIGFFGPATNTNCGNKHIVSPGIWCLTGNETMSIWHWDAAQRMCSYGGTDIRTNLTTISNNESSGFGSIDYLVGCHWFEEQQQLALVAGSSNGNAAIFDVCNDGSFSLHGALCRGHMGCVRGFDFAEGARSIITGGEDARLCEWKVETTIGSMSPLANSNLSASTSKPRSGGGPISRRHKGKKTSASPY